MVEHLDGAASGEMRRRVELPSWLLSLMLHLAVLIMLALFVRGPHVAASLEADRQVGIALAQSAAENVEYFDESDTSDPKTRRPSDAGPLAPDNVAQLPDVRASSALTPAHLALPGNPTVFAATDDLLPQPDLTGHGRVRLPSGGGDAEILAEEAARRRRLEALGPKTEVSLFGGAPAVGRSFVFVVDRSKSMGGEGLGALTLANQEFKRALASLKPSHRFQIIAYHHQRVMFGDERLVAATDANKQRVSQFMGGLAAFGGTDHQMALKSALYLKPDAIFLLTDGGDPPLSESQLAQIHKMAGGHTSIHCIQFGFGLPPSDDNFMHRLARQNGGSYRYVDMSGRRR